MNMSDDEPIPQEFVWHELYKRIHTKEDKLHIELFQNDDWSVLYTLLETIGPGITHQELVWNKEIEAMHNVILRNTSKNEGNGRLKELRRLETLLSEHNGLKLFLTDIIFVKLNTEINAKHLMYLNIMCPNIKKLCLVQTPPQNSDKMFHQLSYLECCGPKIEKIPCNITEIYVKNAQHLNGMVQHSKIRNIYLKDCSVFDWEFKYFLSKKIIVTENTTVKVWDTKKRVLQEYPAEEFSKKLENKKKQFYIPPFKCN
jgi:hypothetical protein